MQTCNLYTDDLQARISVWFLFLGLHCFTTGQKGQIDIGTDSVSRCMIPSRRNKFITIITPLLLVKVGYHRADHHTSAFRESLAVQIKVLCCDPVGNGHRWGVTKRFLADVVKKRQLIDSFVTRQVSRGFIFRWQVMEKASDFSSKFVLYVLVMRQRMKAPANRHTCSFMSITNK